MQKKRLKLLFMIDSMAGGGAERVLGYILRNFDREKYEVHLFTLIREGIHLESIPSPMPEYYVFGDVNRFRFIPFRYLYRFYRRSLLEIFKIFPLLLSAVCRINEHYDVGISFCEGHNTPLLRLKKKNFTKRISWIHVDLRTHRCVLNRKQLFASVKVADRLYFVSEDALTGFKETFPDLSTIRSEVIYNPIDRKQILLAGENKPGEDIEKRALTLVAIGRLVPQKRFDKLLSVHKKLLDKGIFHQVWILGEGSDRDKLEKQIDELGISSTCRLLGFRDPYPVLRLADVFVMTSDYEGLPVVVCEAMVLCKPIVSTRVSGLRELLGNGRYGLLVDNSEDAIEKGLSEMISDDKLRAHYSEELKMHSSGFIFPEGTEQIERKLEELCEEY